LRFGGCFGLIFLLGMQEVMVSASPFSEWGLNFVIYQFFMGFGEAIVALILCIIIAKYTIKGKENEDYFKENIVYNKVTMVILISLMFTIERTVAYITGITSSDIAVSPIPCIGWIIDGAMLQVLIRSVLDIIIIFITVLFGTKSCYKIKLSK
jgi:uncharacterized membrane protein